MPKGDYVFVLLGTTLMYKLPVRDGESDLDFEKRKHAADVLVKQVGILLASADADRQAYGLQPMKSWLKDRLNRVSEEFSLLKQSNPFLGYPHFDEMRKEEIRRFNNDLRNALPRLAQVEEQMKQLGVVVS